MPIVYSCTCHKGACYVDGKCHSSEYCQYQARTNEDIIRSMTSNELYDFLNSIAREGPWTDEFEDIICSRCEPVEVERNILGKETAYYECDYEDSRCPYNEDALKWWLHKEVL